jgi:hypothetical protein
MHNLHNNNNYKNDYVCQYQTITVISLDSIPGYETIHITDEIS